MGKKVKVETSRDVMEANAEAIEFNSVRAHEIFVAMASSDTGLKSSKAARDNASLDLCKFAKATVDANSAISDRATIVRGFVKNLDAMRPMLAAEGSPFVEVKATEKETRYTWKGHGANVKSIAKGVAEYAYLDIDNAPAIVDVDSAESFTVVKKSVEAARRSDETDDARALRVAKDALRETLKEIQSFMLESDDKDLIEIATLELAEWLIKQKVARAEQDALDVAAAEADALDIAVGM